MVIEEILSEISMKAPTLLFAIGIFILFWVSGRIFKAIVQRIMDEKNTVTIKISGQYDGNGYDGMPEKRNYQLKLHGSKPEMITIKTDKLAEIIDTAALDKVADGWYFDPDKNITYIKVKTQEAKSAFSVHVSIK